MARKTVKRAFKYRFYPTQVQAAELSRTFGCVRLVYNKALAARSQAWEQCGERVGYTATSALLTGWKKTIELAFLTEVSSVPLQQGLRPLQGAFSNFFAGRAKYPKFKSRKKSRASAEYTPSAFRYRDPSAFRYRDGKLTLAKMDQPLDIVWSRPLPEGASPSTGEKITNPRHERRDRARLAKAQRELSRKAKDSANRAKARGKVAQVHARITDRRKDFLHKLTTRLVRENPVVVIEDLTVRTMVKNRTLARAISDAAWTQLRTMLEYKTGWYGRELVVVDRFLPSTRMCSTPGVRARAYPVAVEHAHLDVRAVRQHPRPRCERGDQPQGRRAGGIRLWSRYETSTGVLPDGAVGVETGRPRGDP